MRRRTALKRSSVGLVVALVVSALGLVHAVPPAAAAPTSGRPLLLIGGTFMGADNRVGYNLDGDAEREVVGWDDVVAWFEETGGYTEDVDLFIDELQRHDDQPPGWTDVDLRVLPRSNPMRAEFRRSTVGEKEDVLVWAEFLKILQRGGASTAGAAPMEASTDRLYRRIKDLSEDGTRQIDVIAHSQSAAIVRAALRRFAEQDSRYPVATMISLGGGNYGISPLGPEFNPAILEDGLDGSDQGPIAALWTWMFGAGVGALSLSTCRDTAFLPVCPDVVRRGTARPDPYNPDSPSWDELYETDFYPRLNRRTEDASPVPGAAEGHTRYVHLYSTQFVDGMGPFIHEHAVETLPLFPRDDNVINADVQSLCGRGYGLHHVLEWQDRAMRYLVAVTLGMVGPNGPDLTPCADAG